MHANGNETWLRFSFPPSLFLSFVIGPHQGPIFCLISVYNGQPQPIAVSLPAGRITLFPLPCTYDSLVPFSLQHGRESALSQSCTNRAPQVCGIAICYNTVWPLGATADTSPGACPSFSSLPLPLLHRVSAINSSSQDAGDTTSMAVLGTMEESTPDYELALSLQRMEVIIQA